TRLEYKPDDRRPPQHQNELAGAPEQRLAPQQDDYLVEHDEGGIPREHVEPGGDGGNLVGEKHGGGDQRDHRRRESHRGASERVALPFAVQACSSSSWRPSSTIVATQISASASVERKFVTHRSEEHTSELQSR